MVIIFFFQAEDGIRDYKVTGVQTCALPIFNEVVGDDEWEQVADAGLHAQQAVGVLVYEGYGDRPGHLHQDGQAHPERVAALKRLNNLLDLGKARDDEVEREQQDESRDDAAHAARIIALDTNFTLSALLRV